MTGSTKLPVDGSSSSELSSATSERGKGRTIFLLSMCVRYTPENKGEKK